MKNLIYVICLEVKDEDLSFMNNKEKQLQKELNDNTNSSGYQLYEHIRDLTWYFEIKNEADQFEIKLNNFCNKIITVFLINKLSKSMFTYNLNYKIYLIHFIKVIKKIKKDI